MNPEIIAYNNVQSGIEICETLAMVIDRHLAGAES